MITWDDAKRRSNLAKHGLDFAEAEAIFDGPIFTEQDTREAYGEPGFKTLGMLHGRVIVLVWTERDDELQLISLRYGDKRETRDFFKQLQP
ncbi:BrnT family toxin [Lamprobacter modestohalophilus]|uniref:BrnT family toxin n=1 Tax=Lamprobacter modestohalophilus TaxID=1064514 RepID=UPI002ADEF0F4|nr:BrnT family toxin [Lamprobacter modestohalophilus]MEA1049979.1 BrnT family toxin [Lamprobacter modestohalophilus]